jgi:putative ABC transport system permease protein
MKYLPLVWSGLARKPLHPILTMVAVAFAAALAAFAAAMVRVLPRNQETAMAAGAVASAGFLLILLLTFYAVSQSLRARAWEFALLRALGFSRRRLAALLFLEVAAACLAGAFLGLALAQLLFLLAGRLFPAGLIAPSFLPLSVVGLDIAAALLVALMGTAWPALGLMRQNLAAALARGRP